MAHIHYSLIGSHPEVEYHAAHLHEIIAEWKCNNKTRIVTGVLIELIAAHSYGLDSDDFDTITDLIDGIEGMDQHAKFH